MNKKLLFISGIFRSGTTLLSRMLNAHDEITCASDPLRPLFNSYRYDLGDEEYKRQTERFSPLDDYFKSNTKLLRKIMNSDFRKVLVREEPARLLEIISGQSKPYSGIWSDYPKSQDAFSASYADAIDYSIKIIDQLYSKSRKTEVVAFKEVWTNEFAFPLFKTYPELKSILVIRDPRAVVASNKLKKARYPLIFLCRQWRKQAFLIGELVSAHFNRVFLVKYEDLVMDPYKTTREISRFSCVKFDEKVVTPSLYVDGDNQPWYKNTSYNEGLTQEINTRSKDSWKEVLDDNEIRTIEYFCSDWMNKFNYNTSFAVNDLKNYTLADYPFLREIDIADWIKPYVFENDYERMVREFECEKKRWVYMFNKTISENERFMYQLIGK